MGASAPRSSGVVIGSGSGVRFGLAFGGCFDPAFDNCFDLAFGRRSVAPSRGLAAFLDFRFISPPCLSQSENFDGSIHQSILNGSPGDRRS